MKIIQHRINTSKQLLTVPGSYGIELDIRTTDTNLMLHHDPFCVGEHMEDFLLHYKHAGIILNTKVDGLEMQLIDMMRRFGIDDYFFLDLTLPALIKTIRNGCHRVAVRFSEYEPLEFVSKFQGLAEWVWVDCFTCNVLSSAAYTYLHAHFKICVVSPELQGHPLAWIDDFKKAFQGFELDAVCTKHPELWK